MAHKEVVHLLWAMCNLAEGGHEQILPELPLDLDGVEIGVLFVESFQGRYIALVGGAVRPQELCAMLSLSGVTCSTAESARSRSHS